MYNRGNCRKLVLKNVAQTNKKPGLNKIERSNLSKLKQKIKL